MKKLARTFAVSALTLALSQNAAAAQFSGVIAFGDSLSDSGQYGARFTVNRPGAATAIERVARYYGYILFPTIVPRLPGPSITPADRPNYSQGGQRVSQPSPLTPVGAPQNPVSAQIDNLLRGPVDPGALYSVWVGANDIFVNLSAASAGQITVAQVQTNIGQAANDLLTQIGRLRNAGARYIMVFNLPDIGKTPAFLAQSPDNQFSASLVTNLYNSILSNGLDRLGFDVIPINTFALLNEIFANPGLYGFTNTNTPACTSLVGGQLSALGCTPNTLRAPNADETFVFSDGVHPTNAAHQVLSQYVVSVIEAPEKMALLAEAPVQVVNTHTRSIEARQMLAGQRDSFAVYGGYTYDRIELDATARSPGLDNDVNSFLIGGEKALSSHASAGAAFGYGSNTYEFGSGAGGFKLKQTMATGYVNVARNAWYAGAQLTFGNLDFRDIKRNIPLGATVRTEQSETSGSLLQAKLSGGWNFALGSWTMGPIAAVTYQTVRVNEFTEAGNNSTTMRFNDQERDSLTTSLGAQLVGHLNAGAASFKPFLRATWEYEHKNDPREVRARLVTMGGSFALPAYQADDNYVKVDVGLGVQFSKSASGFIAYHTTLDQRDNKQNAVTIGLRFAM